MKTISKIVGAGLALAMAVGVGVVFGASKKEAMPVHAADSLAYTLDGTIAGTGSGYGDDNSATQKGVSWTINGNVTMNPWRIGGKSISNTSRKIKSDSAVSSQNISKVVLSVGTASSITVNSLKLYVGTSAGGAETSTVSGTFAANSDITFNRPSGADWSNSYFTFDFNVTVSVTSNKFVQFKSAAFYYEASGSIDDVTISGTTSITSGYLGLATTQLSATVTTTGGLDETVTWESDDTSVAVVNDDGLVRFLKNDTANITATSTVDTTVSDTVAVTAQNLTAYTGYTDTADFTDTSTWGTTTISDFSGTLTNISFADGGSTGNKLAYNKAGNMRIYTGTILTLTCSSAYSIEYVTLTSESGYPFTAVPTSSEGNVSLFDLECLADTTANTAQSVSFTYTGSTAYIDSMSVYYVSTGSCGISIDNPISTANRSDSGTFTATTSGATSPVITWSSSDSDVISIDSSTGEYSVDFVGTTTITASLSCVEGTDSASFDVTVSGNVSIAEANTILSGLSSGEQTTYKVTLTASIINLNPNSKESGSENELTLADYKVGGTGNDLLVYGVTNNTKLSGEVFRNFAILNGTLSITGYLKNYSGTYELVSPTLVSYTDDAIVYAEYAYNYLDEACQSGTQAVTAAQWSHLSSKYSSDVDEYSKEKLVLAKADPSNYGEAIINWSSRYNILIAAGFDDYVVSANSAKTNNNLFGVNESINIIVIVAAISLTSVGAFFVLRKRKENI